MVIKINHPSTPFTSSEWYEYFFKKTMKNTKQVCLLRECFKYSELHCPFLDESQHWGRVYQLLGIPHVCGKVNKSKLKEIYKKEKKDKFNRLNKLNVGVKKTIKKENKDYRTVVRRNRIINKPNVHDDQKKSDLENKENNFNNELNSNKYGNRIDKEASKKKVRFNNVQVLCFDKSFSSESDAEYLPTLSYNAYKNEIHKPYYEKLNDSQNSEFVSDDNDNDNDTGIISPTSSGEEVETVVNSQLESQSNDQGKTNETSQQSIVSDNEDNDNNTGIISPIEIVSENSNETSQQSMVSDNEDNDIDTGIISPISSGEEAETVVNSQLESYPNDQGKTNETSQQSIVSDNEDNDNDTGIISPIKIVSENINETSQQSIISEDINEKSVQSFNESNEILSDIAEKVNDIGLVSPLPCSMEYINETSEDNASNIEEVSIRSSDLSSEEEILYSPGEYKSREIIIAREIAIRKPKVLTDFNSNENINNQRGSRSASPDVFLSSCDIKRNFAVTHVGNSEEELNSYNTLCTSLTDLSIDASQEAQKSEEISDTTQKTKELIENEKASKLLNMPNENSSLDVESDELSSDFNEQNLADSLHLNADELVFFIPTGNLIFPKVDHLEDYRLSSCSSIGSIGTSLLKKDLGFENISKNKIICDEELEEQNLKNDSLVRDSSGIRRQKGLNILESSTPINDKENQNRCDDIDTNSKELLKTKRNPPEISLDTNKENQWNDLEELITSISEDDSSKIIPNSSSFSSEIKEQNHNNKESTKRKPLQLLGNNTLNDRFVNKKAPLRNDTIQDKENSILLLTNQVLSEKSINIMNEKTHSEESIINQPVPQETDEQSSFEILPPSYNAIKDAYTLQEKIRSLYKSKVKNKDSVYLLKQYNKHEILDLVRSENSSINSDDKEINVSKKDENMSTKVTAKAITCSEKIQEDFTNKESSINSNRSLSSERVLNINKLKQCVTKKLAKQCHGNKNEDTRGNDNVFQLRSSKANIFQTSIDNINDPRSQDLYLNIRNGNHTDSSEEKFQVSAEDNDALDNLKRKTSLTLKNTICSDYDENYADSSSNDSNESIVLHKKVKRRRKKPTAIARMKNISNNNKSPEVTSDDMELIENIQRDNKRSILETLPFKKTTTTDKIMISQNVSEKTINQSNNNNNSSSIREFDSIGGGQRITEELEMKKKTSVVKQQISNISSDTSTTSEFISYALARRIFYLNQST